MNVNADWLVACHSDQRAAGRFMHVPPDLIPVMHSLSKPCRQNCEGAPANAICFATSQPAPYGESEACVAIDAFRKEARRAVPWPTPPTGLSKQHRMLPSDRRTLMLSDDDPWLMDQETCIMRNRSDNFGKLISRKSMAERREDMHRTCTGPSIVRMWYWMMQSNSSPFHRSKMGEIGRMRGSSVAWMLEPGSQGNLVQGAVSMVGDEMGRIPAGYVGLKDSADAHEASIPQDRAMCTCMQIQTRDQT